MKIVAIGLVAFYNLHNYNGDNRMVIIITIDFPLDKDSPHSKIFHL